MIYIIAWTAVRRTRDKTDVRSGPGAKQGRPGQHDAVYGVAMRELLQNMPRSAGWSDHQVTVSELAPELLQREIQDLLKQREETS